MNLKPCLRSLFVVLGIAAVIPAFPCAGEAVAAQRPHGLEPADDMPAMPVLGNGYGLRNQTFKNSFGQVRALSEAIVLRQSSIAGGKANVQPGGLYYISEVKDEVRPLARDPFLVLGEHAYLVDVKRSERNLKGSSVKRGEKKVLDDDGYRLWFDYATDHYDKPYVQLALIAPSGHWPQEFAVSSEFHDIYEVEKLTVPNEEFGQVDPYFQDKEFVYGASRFKVKKNDYQVAEFESLIYPVIDEATFSMSRPWVLDIRQENYRFYKNKRIYAFRRPEGFLVRVTDFSGDTVLGEKLVRPTTAQAYKDRDGVKDDYSLTIPELDMRIEIALEPEFMKNSDFAPWSNDVPYGWQDGILSFVVYSDLVNVKRGEAWPLDPRYKVGLEANLLTGNLQRLVLENANPIVLSNENGTVEGPIKWSSVWNRPAFTVVAEGFSDKAVSSYYVRDAFFQRTDNMVFFPDKGRKDVDFFLGTTPTLVSILEDTFLTRLADNTFGSVVEPSHFTSFPNMLTSAAFYSPDHTAPFVGRMRGFGREQVTNDVGEKITSAEALVVRGSYVDWRNDRVVIPASGLYYTSRNSRNVRTTRSESFYLFGKRAYIATFSSGTAVRKDFDVDFWKTQPTADMNPVFWQDTPIGENNKMLRYTQHAWMDDRPLATINIIKYSGNNFGAPFMISQGLNHEDLDHNRYALQRLYAEGATWIIPEYVGANTVRVKEFVTPVIHSVSCTYTKPEAVSLAVGESVKLGKNYEVFLTSADPVSATATIEIRDKSGAVKATKVLGPYTDEAKELMPQHQRIVDSIQLVHEDVMAELNAQKPFEGDKVGLKLYVDLMTFSHDQPLPFDNRFTIRPDVCGHCYQLNELLFDNPEPIILDKEHPRYDGPKGPDGVPMFTLVLDDFDGEMIQGWHVETTVKGRAFSSGDLAFNPRNNVDCLIGVNGTIEGFLRASLLERIAYQEYWRNAQHKPVHKGLAAWYGHYFQ